MQSRRVQVISLAVLFAVLVSGVVVYHFAIPAYSAAQNRNIGANVTVTGSKVPINMNAVAMAQSQKLSTDFRALTSTIQITPAGGLPAPVTLRFKMGQQVTPSDIVLVETSESPNGPWTLVQPTISADGWYASVQTTHLSSWRTTLFNVTSAIATFSREVLNSVTADLTTQATPPHCDNEAQARQDGYLIKSDAKDTVYWCFGIEGGSRVLKIVNRMRYTLEVSHPGLTVKHLDGPTIGLDQLARAISGQSTMLYPFEEVDYNVSFTPGNGALVSTQYSGLAQSLYQLEFGVVLAINFLSDEGAESAVGNGKASVSTFAKVMDYLQRFLDKVDCANAVIGNKAGDIFVKCFNWDALKSVFGWKSLLLGPLMTTYSVEDYFLTQFDSIHDLITGRAAYQILVGINGPSTVGSSGSSGSAGSPAGAPGGGGSVPPPPSTASIQIAWSSAYSAYVSMTLTGFARGTYQYTCNFASGGNATFTLNVSSEPQTFDNGHTCYDKQAGDSVWVTIGSVSSNKLTVSASPPPPPAPQSIQIGWSSAHPSYIWMTLNGFPVGSYQYTCSFSSGGNATFTLSETSEPETWDNGHTCYDKQAGDVVWVVIGSVSSNKITVAGSPPPPPPPTTYAETAGGVAHTWTDYSSAGGTQGQSVAAYQTIQIACKVTGFKVADGNTWWYRIAQSPWSNQYYVSADAFYNNGQTSGSLSGTPWVDNNVPNC